MWDIFVSNSRAVIFYAQEAAQANHLVAVGPEEILQGILRLDCDGRRALQAQGVDLDKLQEMLNHEGKAGVTKDIVLSPGGKKAIDLALKERSDFGFAEVSTSMLLIGCIRCGSPLVDDAVDRFHISVDEVRKHMLVRS